MQNELGSGDLGMEGGFAEATVPQRDTAGVVRLLGDLQGPLRVRRSGVRIVVRRTALAYGQLPTITGDLNTRVTVLVSVSVSVSSA